MSEERELLKELSTKDMVSYYYPNLINRIKELLAQPMQLTREPLTGKEISHGFRSDEDATNAESYWAGVVFAEKYYGITGGSNE